MSFWSFVVGLQIYPALVADHYDQEPASSSATLVVKADMLPTHPVNTVFVVFLERKDATISSLEHQRRTSFRTTSE